MGLRLAALVIFAVASSCARAHPGPVCGSPEVLRVVEQLVAERGLAAVIDPGSVGEGPTARPQTVLCAVRLHGEFYDTDRFGPVPQPWTQRFE